jgi:hypothetical protein
VEYVLVHNPTQTPIAGNGLGWTLIARRDGWCWSSALAARGAGAHAAARVAQAVAVRVLAEQGVTVTGWSTGASDTESTESYSGPAAFARLSTPDTGHRRPDAGTLTHLPDQRCGLPSAVLADDPVRPGQLDDPGDEPAGIVKADR